MAESILDLKFRRGELNKSMRLVYELIEILGYDPVMLLLEKHGGESVYLPVLKSLDRILRRDVEIMRQRNAGMTYREIAKIHNLSVRRIHQLFSVTRQPPAPIEDK